MRIKDFRINLLQILAGLTTAQQDERLSVTPTVTHDGRSFQIDLNRKSDESRLASCVRTIPPPWVQTTYHHLTDISL